MCLSANPGGRRRHQRVQRPLKVSSDRFYPLLFSGQLKLFRDMKSKKSRRAKPASSSNALATILLGGVLVALLDGLEAILFFGLKDVSAFRICQFIASAVLGRWAFFQGTASALVGAVLHCGVAVSLTAVFYGLARLCPWILRFPWWSGTVYGLASYAVINYWLIPLTKLPQSMSSLPVMINGIFAHVVVVGLPIAFVVRTSFPRASGAARASR